mmetsp:Transcript_167486/g.537854  ORF Transcript_167486/g.537854 Transcript_167486/m.537854 type:complete len:91 (+) Transcript_167486:1-273(+)
MASAHVELDTITYNAAVSACEKCGEWDHAVQILVEMASAHVELDAITYNAEVSAYETGGECDRAFRLLVEMVSSCDICLMPCVFLEVVLS